MKLTVDQAQIHTANVEVKTLTISGKQVTLAVFRQLVEDDLLDEDCNLRGVPWGVVNYHPSKDCGGDDTDHWHVVWQSGSDLRRSTVWPYRLESKSFLAEEYDHWVAWRIAWEADFRAEYGGPPGRVDRTVHWVNMPGFARILQPAVGVGRIRYHPNVQGEWVDDDERLSKLRELYPEDCGPSLKSEAAAAGARGKALLQRRADRLAEVLALPQLFIAV